MQIKITVNISAYMVCLYGYVFCLYDISIENYVHWNSFSGFIVTTTKIIY